MPHRNILYCIRLSRLFPLEFLFSFLNEDVDVQLNTWQHERGKEINGILISEDESIRLAEREVRVRDLIIPTSV